MDISTFNNIFPAKEDIKPDYLIQPIHQNEYLINGEIRLWNGEKRDVYSPICINENGAAKETLIGSYPILNFDEAIQGVNAAVAAFNNGRGKWPTMSVENRIQCVKNFIICMKEKRSEIVKLLMWEICKTLPDAEKEFDRTVEYMEATINALKELDRVSSRFVFEQGIFAQIRRAPLGVVLCMGPFNYPLNETFTTLIPALIMGNTVLFKPAKHGALFFGPLLKPFRDCFPEGVVNTIYGDGRTLIGPLMATGKIDVFAFIGSAESANAIQKQHPKPNRLKCVLGLGAKNPAIILEDADIDLSVKECLLGSLSYNGQRCTALKIIFVHKNIAEKFLKKFTEAVSKLKVGMPWENGVSITPLPEKNKTQHMQDYIADALNAGARIINENGGAVNKTVFFPAVLYPVNEKMKIYREEQFGPIVPVVPFDSIDTPIEYINTSNAGQQASIFGTDPELMAKLVDPLVNQVCRVNINSQCQRGPDSFPFTGRKDSAEGTLSVSDALRVFSIRTLVAAKENDLNKKIIGKIVKDRASNFLSTDFIL
ncbi:MAG: NADP-dependent glyceraldehyde-3-phosphate dehydrogenase [Candidatus Wallbacteria bacterium]